jgi:hypothetical protein
MGSACFRNHIQPNSRWFFRYYQTVVGKNRLRSPICWSFVDYSVGCNTWTWSVLRRSCTFAWASPSLVQAPDRPRRFVIDNGVLRGHPTGRQRFATLAARYRAAGSLPWRWCVCLLKMQRESSEGAAPADPFSRGSPAIPTANRVGGIARPSAVAVLRLTTISNVEEPQPRRGPPSRPRPARREPGRL